MKRFDFVFGFKKKSETLLKDLIKMDQLEMKTDVIELELVDAEDYHWIGDSHDGYHFMRMDKEFLYGREMFRLDASERYVFLCFLGEFLKHRADTITLDLAWYSHLISTPIETIRSAITKMIEMGLITEVVDF